MTKEELIRLKRILESNNDEYCDLLKTEENDGSYYQGTIVNISDIYERLNTKKAVEVITKNFESAIYHYCMLGKNFNEMIINPCICPFINIEDINEIKNCNDLVTLKKNYKLLSDIVVMDLYRLFVKDEEGVISKIGDSEFIKNYDSLTWFVVSLKELKELLIKEGLELKGINTEEDLLNDNYNANITIDFNTKSLTKVKK